MVSLRVCRTFRIMCVRAYKDTATLNMLRSKNKLLELTALIFLAFPAFVHASNPAIGPVGAAEVTPPKSVLFTKEEKVNVDPLGDIIEKLDYSSPLYTGEEVDVWGRVRKGFAIPDLDNELVAKQLSW